MSGFEALGAAAAIIQLTETGIKYGKKAIAIYESKNGLDKDFRVLDQVTEEFRTRNRELLEKCTQRSDDPKPEDDALGAIAIQCEQSAAELSALIDQVRMKDRTKWKAVVSLWKSERKRDQIEAKQRELSHWRRACQDQLQTMMVDEQFALARTLKEVSRRQRESETALSKQLTSFRREILDILSNAATKGTSGLVQKLLEAQKTGGSLLPREDILNSLYFEEIQLRWDMIARPTRSTYAWMFNRDQGAEPPVRYVKWLEEEGDIFWVTGRAGSGKSTLMKFIRHHPETEKSLRKWANGRDLLIADYYFWYRGEGLQKSHVGLLRSILYKVLEQCPELIEHVCKQRWAQATNGRDTRRMPWSVTELQDAADMLSESDLKIKGRDICYCFFIDGLDEYSGNPEDIVRTLEKLAAGPTIKICASSRPWNEFKYAFKKASSSGNSIEVHLHTKRDIETVVNTELDDVLKNLDRNRAELDFLVSEIVSMSQGVFLWVILVLRRELVPMLKDWETTESLRKRLCDIPEDLVKYFEDIFNKVWKDTKFRKDTARIFRTCITARRPIPLVCLDVMVKDDPEEYAHAASIDQPFVWGDPDSIKAATAQLNARCLDLLCVEIVHPDGTPSESLKDQPYGVHRISFLHRTVADFLVENAVAQDLNTYSGTEFDAESTLFACYAFLVKRSLAFDSLYTSLAQDIAISWSTTSLLYCPKTLVRPNTAKLIRDIDESMGRLFRDVGKAHWTNYMISGASNDSARGYRVPSSSMFAESAGRDIIGHLIELGVVDEVKIRLSAAPELFRQKKGRPYLDYALRYDQLAAYRGTNLGLIPISTVFQPDLVEMLLSLGCDVNQQVWIYDGRTVWDLYLAFLYDELDLIDTKSALAVTQLLVEAGAKDVPRCVLSQGSEETTAKYRDAVLRHKVLSMQQILEDVFGPEHGRNLAIDVQKNSTKGWLSWVPMRWK